MNILTEAHIAHIPSLANDTKEGGMGKNSKMVIMNTLQKIFAPGSNTIHQKVLPQVPSQIEPLTQEQRDDFSRWLANFASQGNSLKFIQSSH